MSVARYDLFETGFNNFDETINFGARAIGGDKSLYEICTLAVIRSSEGASSSSGLNVTSHHEVDGMIFLGINNSLRIIKSIEQPDQIGAFEFEHFLDSIAVSPCARFILISTRSGNIFIHDLSAIAEKQDGTTAIGESNENGDFSINGRKSVYYEFPQVFTEKIECPISDTPNVIGTLADVSSEFIIFFVVTSRGLVKKIQLDRAENGEEKFTSQMVFDFKQNIKICAFAYPFLCLEGEEIFILDLRNNIYETDEAIGLKSLHSIGHNFLAFDSEGNIYVIDSARCLIFEVNNEFPYLVDLFTQLRVLIDGDKKYIVGITKNEPRIQLFPFQNPNAVYDIDMPHPAYLLNTRGITEEVLFLAEVRKNNTLIEIRLQYVTETDPELRVKKFIQKGLIEKAELFAQSFNVNPNFLAEAKATHIVEKLECTTEEVNELLKILDTITDQTFRMECCDTVICKTATDTRRILCHAAFMEIGVRDSSENDHNMLLFYKRSFNRKLHRFDIYMQVYGDYDQRKWSYFADCNLIEEVKEFLKQGQAKEAALIYSRLDREEIVALTEEGIEEVIGILNKPFEYTPFLKTFIPLTLKYKPDALIILVQWVHDKVYHMEKQSDLDFPECAIKFLEEVTSLMNVYIPARSYLGDESREVLVNLLKALNNIQMLVNNFSLTLPLSEYLSAPHDIVRTLLNTDMEPTHLEMLMKEFLYPFMLKSGVDTDSLLIEEIKSLFVYDEEYFLDVVHVLLKFVCKVDVKLEAIKQILEIAAKPWSDTVKDIARMAFEHKSTSLIVDEIVELLRDEPILIVLEKYKINRNLFMSDKIYHFRRILYLNRDNCEQAYKDIHQLCRDDEDRLQANLLMIKEFIKWGYAEEAMTFLDKLEPQKICVLGRELLEDILCTGEQEIFPVRYLELYGAALRPLWNRLSRYTEGKEKAEIQHSYNIASAVYGIYSHYGVKVNSLMLKGPKKEHTLEVLFQKVTDLLSEGDPPTFEKLLRNLKRLASIFGDPLETIFLKYMKFDDTFSMFLNIGKHLLETSQCSELLTLCAVYLFKYTKENVSDIGNETFLDVVVATEKNTSDNDVLEAVLLARKLCVKAMMYSTEVDQMPILEVLSWIDSCYYCTIEEELSFHAEIYQIYLPSIRPFYFGMSFEKIKKMFNMYCALAESLEVDNKYLTYFKSNSLVTVDDLRQDMEQFIWNARALLKQEQHLTVFNIIRVLQQSCLSSPDMQDIIIKPLQKFMIDTVVPETVEVVMSYKFIDKTLLLGLMLLLEKETYETQLNKYLTIYKRRPKKLNVITQVGLNLLTCRGVECGRVGLLNILYLCKWWFRINDPEIKYETFFTSKPENVETRLEMLIKEDKVKLESLPEYCTDFGLDLQNCYLKYLKIILLHWQPIVEYVTEVTGKKNIIIKNSENELMAKCSKVVERISNKIEVFKLTEEIWPLVNFYYYEVYLVLLTLHLRSSSPSTIPIVYRPLLYFLKTYTRVSSPARSEIEQWFGAFPMKALVDPLSEFRLPLTSTFLSGNIWDIIKQEVNLDTYKEWFKVVPILQHLNQEDICTYAINSAGSSGLINTTCNTWELSLKYDHLFSKVYECVQNISDIERATAPVYWLMREMPPGADKVQMAELSFRYVRLYRESNPNDDVEKVYVKVRNRYLHFSAIHILHKYQLAEEKYLEQVSQPSDLIWELYNDPRVDKYSDNLLFECPDINRAVEELCTLFSLSIKKESSSVILKLLKLNSSLELDCSQLPRGKDSIHLKRACYVCKSQDVKFWQKYLIDHGTKHVPESDMSFKSNALRCFYYISDMETVTEMSGMDHGQFVTYLNKVAVIAKMGDLGLKFETVMQLDQQNHKRIMKNLASTNKPLAIKCIASLCKIYGLDDLKYWEYIVITAIQFHMLSELRDYLEFLKGRCVSDSIKMSWDVLLTNSLTNLSFSAASESDIFLLLQACPVIHELDIESYIQLCILNDKRGMADFLLQFRK